MVISSQAEEYLEAMCRILDRGESATPTELARELGVAPPSVLGMVRRLEEQGLVTYARGTGAVLTPLGVERAALLRRRHRLAERMLTDLLGVPWDRAHEIACRFEHVIDGEVEGYLLDALDHPTTCPHGNPLDGSTRTLRPLSALRPGEAGEIRCILNESATMLSYCTRLQLHPGARVYVRDCAPFDGPLTVEVGGEIHALARTVAGHLLIDCEERV